MAALLQFMKVTYQYIFYDLGDPRTENWWLMSGPGPLLTILATYLYFCNSVGPKYMRDRKPYDLKNVMILYNFSHILISIFLVYEGLAAGWWNDYSFSCQPVDYSNSPKALRMAAGGWWYLAAKIFELLDTVIFVLRKNDRQITFLHLYHHFMMPICAWIGVKYLPGGHGGLLAVINSFIHIIMYTYYLISGLGTQFQKYLWWKKHLTTMQLKNTVSLRVKIYEEDGSLPSRAQNEKPKDANSLGSVTSHDPRTENWWLMSGPGPLLTILATYLFFCNSVGPKYMRDRKPYDLKNFMILYNVSQILMSIFLVYEGLAAGWWNDYSFSCQPVDYSNNPKALRMVAGVWWYFAAKIIELLDTVIFVLRKNDRQITFLHLYHHFLMPITAWIGVKYLPGGHATLLGLINSFIHIIMYTYYLISALGPQYQKYVWWKKHLTTMQLIQFCIIFYHNFTVMFRDCNYPKGINFLLSLNCGLFIYMFGNFYYNNYIKNKKGVQNAQVTANRKPKVC